MMQKTKRAFAASALILVAACTVVSTPPVEREAVVCDDTVANHTCKPTGKVVVE